MDRNNTFLLVALVFIIGMIAWVFSWDVGPARTTTTPLPGTSTGGSTGTTGASPGTPVTPTAPPIPVPSAPSPMPDSK